MSWCHTYDKQASSTCVMNQLINTWHQHTFFSAKEAHTSIWIMMNGYEAAKTGYEVHEAPRITVWMVIAKRYPSSSHSKNLPRFSGFLCRPARLSGPRARSSISDRINFTNLTTRMARVILATRRMRTILMLVLTFDVALCSCRNPTLAASSVNVAANDPNVGIVGCHMIWGTH